MSHLLIFGDMVSNDSIYHNWQIRTSSYQGLMKDIIQEESFLVKLAANDRFGHNWQTLKVARFG